MLVLILIIIVLIHVLILSLLALLTGLALLLLELAALLRLLGGDLAAAEAEPAEEADTAHTGLLHELEELLGGLGLASLAGLLLVVDLLGQAKHAVGQVLALLPLDVDGLRNETGPAVLVVAPPELLLDDLVLEPVVLLELPLEGDAAGVALGELEALDGQVGEGLEEELRVAGLDVLVNIGRSLLEDKGPELGDLGDDLLATDVEVPGELILLADL